jgi:16S rRNA (cytosine967-C5)-methyltransferase
MQERVGAGGQVVAVDASAARCGALRRLLAERCLENVRVFQAGELSSIDNEIGEMRFDRILLDVPCSNSGVLARRPEARYSWQIDCLVAVQKRILDDTANRLAPGGRMVYSTCSIWPAENERQIEDFLARHPGFNLLDQQTILPSFQTTDPSQYHDGGYLAVLGISG